MKTTGDITRRSILATPFVGSSRISFASPEITFVGFGGLYQAAQTRALFEPFTRETGIRVRQATDVIDLGNLEQEVRTHRAPSLLCLPDRLILSAADAGLLAELDYNVIDASDVGHSLVQPHFVGAVLLAMMLTTRSSLDPAPVNWQQFWDVEHFTGNRGLYDGPAYSLEFALLADGVAMDALYPLDLDRAFKSLDRIKAHVSVWWSSFSAPDFLFDTGNLDMTPWTRSVALILRGKPLRISYEGAAITFEGWCVPRNSENPEDAMKFINWAIQPQRQAELANLITFSPTSIKALKLVDAAVLPYLAAHPSNLERGFFLSGEWWRQNYASTTARWRRWRNT